MIFEIRALNLEVHIKQIDFDVSSQMSSNIQKNFKKLVFKVHKVFLIFFKESIIGPKLILALILLVNEEDLLKNVLNKPILLVSLIFGIFLVLIVVFFDFILFKL